MFCENVARVLVLVMVTVYSNEAFLHDNRCKVPTYDKNSHVCCGDKLYPIGRNRTCCNGKMIDAGAGICFLGIIRLQNPYSCDGKYYDRKVAFCCNKKIYSKSSTTACCIRQVYDPTKYHCVTFMKIVPGLEKIT
ncbi:hypothetical protein NP493_1147g00087 [Ridgeia piscesae]|uniref:Galaxin-like repeats domain-containing protein n=1 Tax=Ridgeia piscesae TaxID=27915 RepID=A0AAD9KFB6_RIDPI|nr:hypothetical protein NP493_1147g00087 [Ridgeia piscesae]